jgi:eukaryotic-like serine/threonine-protein kinase
MAEGVALFAGKYIIERVLGQGGMGVVLAARHARLGQRVAIKVLGTGLREHPELVRRFEREARAAGSLTSAHAVRIFDIDAIEDGTPFIVMELLAGRDLSTVIDDEGPQRVGSAVRWIIEACDAISEAHGLGIVHRDIKPSNLFLTEEGERTIIKVVDFGIAKHVSTSEAPITQALAPLGTPHYMSPEQVRCAKNVDARTDVWSLGVTLYELLCGRPPFAHESSSACIAAIAADPVPDPRALRPDLGADLVAVMMKALTKNVAQRHQCVAELVAALRPFAEIEESASSSASAAPSRSSIPIVLDLAPLPSTRPRPSAPSTLSMTSVARAQRVRTALAGVSAAALGFAVLVATPRCVATGTRGAASSPVDTPPESVPWPTTTGAAQVPTTSVDVSLAAPPAPVVSQTPIAVARPAQTRRPLAPASTTAPTHGASQPEKQVPTAPRNGAHGGLSGPGF